MESNMEGWIKIHAKFTSWEWIDIPEMVALWVHLLLQASWKDTKWHGVDVKRGQVITSLPSLAKKSGLSVQQVRTCLERLSSTGEITNKSTNKYRIITICKYDIYQLDEVSMQQAEQQAVQQANNRQATASIDNIVLSKESISKDISSLSNTRASSKSDSIDYARIQTMWKELCPSMKKVMLMTDSRKRQVALRVKEMKAAYPDRELYDVLQEFFGKVESSDFLKGGGSQGWKADFDWLFHNDRRWLKVMEGGFDNSQGQKAGGSAQLDVNSLWG